MEDKRSQFIAARVERRSGGRDSREGGKRSGEGALEGQTSRRQGDLSHIQGALKDAHDAKKKNIQHITLIRRNSLSGQTKSGDSAKQWLHHVPPQPPSTRRGGR